MALVPLQPDNAHARTRRAFIFAATDTALMALFGAAANMNLLVGSGGLGSEAPGS
jgi:hypothetical protein